MNVRDAALSAALIAVILAVAVSLLNAIGFGADFNWITIPLLAAVISFLVVFRRRR